MSRIEGIERLEALSRRIADQADVDNHPAWVAHRAEVAGIVDRGSERQLLAGLDCRDRPMAPLKPSTLRHRGGSGPATIPRLQASGPIAALKTSWSKRGDDFVLTVGWPSFKALPFVVMGTRNMPARDFAGIAPRTLAECEAAGERLSERLAREVEG